MVMLLTTINFTTDRTTAFSLRRKGFMGAFASCELLFITLSVSVAIAGCGGSSSPFESVPVSGKVFYEDGSAIPMSGTKLYFYCQVPPVGDLHPRTASAVVGSDGTFNQVTTYKYGDGLVLGKHKVVVNLRDDTKVSKACTVESTTPLTVEVTKSGQVLEIKVPKP